MLSTLYLLYCPASLALVRGSIMGSRDVWLRDKENVMQWHSDMSWWLPWLEWPQEKRISFGLDNWNSFNIQLKRPLPRGCGLPRSSYIKLIAPSSVRSSTCLYKEAFLFFTLYYNLCACLLNETVVFFWRKGWCLVLLQFPASPIVHPNLANIYRMIKWVTYRNNEGCGKIWDKGENENENLPTCAHRIWPRLPLLEK